MRGTFFINGVETIAEVHGESWDQRRPFKVSGSLKKHSDNTSTEDWSLRLVLIDLKKLKKKEEDTFLLLEEVPLDSEVLETTFSPKGLEEDAVTKKGEALTQSIWPVSDGAYTLGVQVGPKDKVFDSGTLQLSITPWPPINEFLQLFENFKRFKVKSIKNKIKEKASTLDVKLAPPGGKEFVAIDMLNLHIKQTQKGLSLKYIFKVKVLTHGPEGVTTKVEKKTIESTLEGKDLFSFGDALNQQGILAHFDSVLENVIKKTTF